MPRIIEFTYKGVQVRIIPGFGYRYVFTYAGVEYLDIFLTFDYCKYMAKEEIDRLTKNGEELGV